jgi:hypothetical protein
MKNERLSSIGIRVSALHSEHATSLHWQYRTCGSKCACTNVNEASKLFFFKYV